MKIEVYALNAFAEKSNGGNPAGVVLNGQAFDEKQMQEIASCVGFSETAFVLDSDIADFRVRFFTPTEEVDFCGHATIGTFYLLHALDKIQVGKYTQETKAGVLSVEIMDDGLVVTEQTKPKFWDKITNRDSAFDKVCKSLGLEPQDIGVRPIVKGDEQDFLVNHMEIVSTGLKDLIVPVKSQERLKKINPDMSMISDISQVLEVTGYHVFALNNGDITAQCRNFAPLVGIDEESATGSSSGALGSFLVKNKIINVDKKRVEMVFEQGIQMKRPSKIYVNVVKEAAWGNRIEEIYVGGNAMDIHTIEVNL